MEQYVCVAGTLRTKPFSSKAEAENFAEAWKGTFSIFVDVKVEMVV